jgi:fructoselysine and glucoselysine-specific PTS system IIC component
MLGQTIAIFFIAALGYMNSFFGSSNLGRPILMSTLVGLALGDVTTGIMVGATLELVWLGVFPIGASNPPDYVSGSIIGAAYVLTTGSDAASACVLAIPVAMLISMVWNFLMMSAVPLLSARADHYAELGDAKKVDWMHYWAIIIQTVPLALIVALGYYFGAPVIESVVNTIPTWITSGLDYATGIIPAIGLAMIARMLIDKKVACFLFLGFVLASFFGLSIIGITCVACILVAILMFNVNTGAKQEVVEDENEF